MAGEVTKTTALTNARAGIKREARYNSSKVREAIDTHQFAAATELEAADSKLFEIELPSNAIVLDILFQNDDMDTHASTPTLAVDIGVAAGAAYTSVTSGTATKHAQDDIIDADLFVDGITTMQAASTNWVSATPDATTWGPEDRTKMIWELLGYDADPHTTFVLAVTSATASAALSAAADLAVRVIYLVD